MSFAFSKTPENKNTEDMEEIPKTPTPTFESSTDFESTQEESTFSFSESTAAAPETPRNRGSSSGPITHSEEQGNSSDDLPFIPPKYKPMFENLSKEELKQSYDYGSKILTENPVLFEGISNWTYMYGFETSEYHSEGFRKHNLNLQLYKELRSEKVNTDNLYGAILAGQLVVPGPAFELSTLKKDLDILQNLERTICGRIKWASEQLPRPDQ